MSKKITRREFIATGGKAAMAASLAGSSLLLKGCATGKDYDLILKGGMVYDGLGNPGRLADVGISGGAIKTIGTIPASRGVAVLDVSGLAVAPGFIDVHDHSDLCLLANPKAESAVRQGVTTTISGQCGSSPFPIAEVVLEDARASAKAVYGVEVDWRDLPGFFERLSRGGIAYNYATLVGHGAVRGAAMGLDDRAPTPEEMERMKALVAENMRQGAWGMSSGLGYTPGSFAAPAELTELNKVVASLGGVYATHMRAEGDGVLDSIDETLETAKAAGVSLQISHLKAAYPANWDKINAMLARIEAARAAGVNVNADRYTYIASSTGLDSLFPDWVRQGTSADIVARLKDPKQEAKLRAALDRYEKRIGSWDRVLISAVVTEQNRGVEGLSILEAAKAAGKPPFEFVRDLLVEENDQVGMINFTMKEENLKRFLAHPLVGVGSDGEARASYGVLSRGKPHPRSYGTFARYLGKYVREEKVLPLETAIMKITSGAARKFGLEKRGTAGEGFFADLVAFDPAKIIDRATWKDPHQYAAGVVHVLVNGVPVIANGDHTGNLPGRILKKTVPG
jgi:N-acyl-D-amino-acid deacylase